MTSSPNLGEAWVAKIFNPGVTVEMITFGQIKHDPSDETVEEADTMIIRYAAVACPRALKLAKRCLLLQTSIGIVDASITSTLLLTFKSLEQTTTKTREFTLKCDILVKKNAAIKKCTEPYTSTTVVTRET
ncbi:hypothetical protein BJ742DRAFT_776214 [Cladochytrium replicatum]|nr:hypothetical protein BJ742DRAFT_776214 [Cladochytrium replicatum]